MSEVLFNYELVKKCSKWEIEKDLSCFSPLIDTQEIRNQCRDCIKLIYKEYQFRNMEKN